MALSHSQQSRTQLLLDPAAAPDEAARHRIPKQSRTGGPVLGVTAMAAALGATGLSATAAAAAAPPAPAPSVAADDTSQGAPAAADDGTADPGLALAARIQQQADSRRTAAEESARLEAAQEAAAKRAQQAEATARAAELAAAEQAAARESAAEQAAAVQPVAVVQPVQPVVAVPPVDLGELALPLAKYTLGAAGSQWEHLHTGLDFAAATGTPVTAVGAGTVTSAGWSGSYGYRVIQTLPDGTELWYCHLASIAVTSGPVAPGAVLGKVGATGNLAGAGVTGPHLHLEVRPGGAAPVDPGAWLQERGLTP